MSRRNYAVQQALPPEPEPWPIISEVNSRYTGLPKYLFKNWSDDGLFYIFVYKTTSASVNNTLVVCSPTEILATLDITLYGTKWSGFVAYNYQMCLVNNNSDKGYRFYSWRYNPSTKTITSVVSNKSIGRNWPTWVTYAYSLNNVDYYCLCTNNTRYLTCVVNISTGSYSATESSSPLAIQWFKTDYTTGDSTRPYLGFWGSTSSMNYGNMTTWEIRRDSSITGAKTGSSGTLMSNKLPRSTYGSWTWAYRCWDNFNKLIFGHGTSATSYYQFIVNDTFTQVTPQLVDWSSITSQTGSINCVYAYIIWFSDGSCYHGTTSASNYDIRYDKNILDPSTFTSDYPYTQGGGLT